MTLLLKKKGYIKIKMEIMKSRHICCQLILNKKKGFFLIDTGASNSCVDETKINFFSLIKNDSEIEVSGAGIEKIKVTPTKKSIFSFKDNNQ